MKISVFIALLLFIGLVTVLPDGQIPIWTGQEIFLEHAVIIIIALFLIRKLFLKLFLIWVTVTTFIRYGKWSMLAFHTVTFFLIFMSIAISKLKKKDFPVILNAICVIALIQVGWMVIQYFHLDPFFKPRFEGSFPLCGFLANPNVTGACLGLSFPLFLRRRWWIFLPVIFF